MVSKVDVYNMALMNLGVTQEVESEADRTTVAKTCNRWYDRCRRQLLEDFPYGFATQTLALARLADVEVPGWDYVYSYPDNCLMLRRIVDAESSRFPLKVLYSDYSHQILTPIKIPFMVVIHPTDPEKKVVTIDFDQAYGIYTVDVVNLELFGELAIDALAWKLAARIGPALSVGGDHIRNAQENERIAESKAQAKSLNEARADPEPESPSITVRY